MTTLQDKALELAAKGFTVIPLRGKAPTILGWQLMRKTTPDDIRNWVRLNLLQNIGMVCGAASNNTVVIDFDGMVGYDAFVAQFPALAETLTVATGSGNGMHVYYKVDLLPDSRAVMGIMFDGGELANIEIKADGKQVVIPPSVHPDTGKEYTTVKRLPIMNLTDISAIWNWAQSLKPQEWQPPQTPRSHSDNDRLNPALLRAVENHFLTHPHKGHGDWINCSCPNTSNHKNGDKDFSFGYNPVGFGHCYVCGEMNLKQLLPLIGMSAQEFGGFYEKLPEPLTFEQAVAPRLAQPIMKANAPAQPAPQTIPVIKRTKRTTNYVNRLRDFETPITDPPVMFPLKVLHEFGGMARVARTGKLIGVVGISGGGKTSLLECMVDGFLSYNTPCLVWSPEWNADEFIERSVQRYGGPSVDELYMHEIFKYEYQQGIKNGVGVELSDDKNEAGIKALRLIQGWEAEVGYLDAPFMNIGVLQSQIGATLAGLDFKPRVLVIDYVQLLFAMETSGDLTMYNLLMRIKAVCSHYGLLGIIASQVTKDGARGQADGKLLDGLAARYVNDDAFNLFITVNPEYDDMGQRQPTAILNIAKSSIGKRGKVRVGVNWERLTFSDKKHANQIFAEDL